MTAQPDVGSVGSAQGPREGDDESEPEEPSDQRQKNETDEREIQESRGHAHGSHRSPDRERGSQQTPGRLAEREGEVHQDQEPGKSLNIPQVEMWAPAIAPTLLGEVRIVVDFEYEMVDGDELRER